MSEVPAQHSMPGGSLQIISDTRSVNTKFEPLVPIGFQVKVERVIACGYLTP